MKAAGKLVLVLIVLRFDREGETRTAFLSAMSMPGARDGGCHRRTILTPCPPILSRVY